MYNQSSVYKVDEVYQNKIENARADARLRLEYDKFDYTKKKDSGQLEADNLIVAPKAAPKDDIENLEGEIDKQINTYSTVLNTETAEYKSRIDNFLAEPDVSIVTSITGCIIPDFVDLNGVTQYIQVLVNNSTPSTGLFCAIDEQAFDDICANGSKMRSRCWLAMPWLICCAICGPSPSFFAGILPSRRRCLSARSSRAKAGAIGICGRCAVRATSKVGAGFTY